jgi:hypothetical protein
MSTSTSTNRIIVLRLDGACARGEQTTFQAHASLPARDCWRCTHPADSLGLRIGQLFDVRLGDCVVLTGGWLAGSPATDSFGLQVDSIRVIEPGSVAPADILARNGFWLDSRGTSGVRPGSYGLDRPWSLGSAHTHAHRSGGLSVVFEGPDMPNGLPASIGEVGLDAGPAEIEAAAREAALVRDALLSGGHHIESDWSWDAFREMLSISWITSDGRTRLSVDGHAPDAFQALARPLAFTRNLERVEGHAKVPTEVFRGLAAAMDRAARDAVAA